MVLITPSKEWKLRKQVSQLRGHHDSETVPRPGSVSHMGESVTQSVITSPSIRLVPQILPRSVRSARMLLFALFSVVTYASAVDCSETCHPSLFVTL